MNNVERMKAVRQYESEEQMAKHNAIDQKVAYVMEKKEHALYEKRMKREAWADEKTEAKWRNVKQDADRRVQYEDTYNKKEARYVDRAWSEHRRAR